jgi:hypothetical protein
MFEKVNEIEEEIKSGNKSSRKSNKSNSSEKNKKYMID